MKSLAATIFVLATIGLASCYPAIQPARPPITIEYLRTHPVIGALGVPLGTAVDIEAVVISGRSHPARDKGDDSRYYLRITKIGGVEIAHSLVMAFEVPSFINAELAASQNDLFNLRNTRQIDTSIAELEAGYVGKRVRLIAYETGEYRGMPANLPDDVLSWQDTAFGFGTRLVVVLDRDQPIDQIAD